MLVDEIQHVAEIFRISDLTADDAGTLQENAGRGNLELIACGRSIDHDAGARFYGTNVIGIARSGRAIKTMT